MSYDAQAWARKIRTGSPTLKAILMSLANRSNDEHACWPSQETISSDTEFDVRTVRRALLKLEDMGILRRQTRTNGRSDMIFLNMSTPESPKRHSKAVHDDDWNNRTDCPGSACPGSESPLDEDTESGGYRSESPDVPDTESADYRTESPPNLNIETPSKQKLETPRNKHKKRKTLPWPEDYREQFWNLYPKKSGDSRKAAWAKLDNLERDDQVEFEAIMTGLRYYARRMNDQVKKNPADEKYIAAASVWINQARWETEKPVEDGASLKAVHDRIRAKGVYI